MPSIWSVDNCCLSSFQNEICKDVKGNMGAATNVSECVSLHCQWDREDVH